MVKKCCVPGCKSNYASTRKENHHYISVFGFPTNETLKESWIKAIYRKDFSPSLHSAVCEFHFDENDILKYDKFVQSDGTVQSVLVRCPRLKENAVPKFFSQKKNPETSTKIEEIDFKSPCPHIKEEVDTSAYDALYPELGRSCEYQEVKFEYEDTVENFIKEEVDDKNNTVVVRTENSYACYVSGQINENESIKIEEASQSEIAHQCNICDETFTEDFDLRTHLEVHVRGYDYRCMICGEAFENERDGAVHVQDHHSKEKVDSCSEYSETFSDDINSKKQASAYQNKVLSSHVCDAELSGRKRGGRNRHCYRKSSESYPCKICGKTFCSKGSQEIHIRKHTGERPFACSFCQKAFRDTGSLRKHERIHTGEKPYVCVVCLKAFNQRVVLRNHIKSRHSAPDHKNRHSRTPYCCAVCTDMFVASEELIVHLIQHCDRNTVLKISSETGKRKYKSRTRLKSEELD